MKIYKQTIDEWVLVLAPNFIREPESVRGLKRVGEYGLNTPGIKKWTKYLESNI